LYPAEWQQQRQRSGRWASIIARITVVVKICRQPQQAKPK
jgi:hypothetical protein